MKSMDHVSVFNSEREDSTSQLYAPLYKHDHAHEHHNVIPSNACKVPYWLHGHLAQRYCAPLAGSIM